VVPAWENVNGLPSMFWTPITISSSVTEAAKVATALMAPACRRRESRVKTTRRIDLRSMIILLAISVLTVLSRSSSWYRSGRGPRKSMLKLRVQPPSTVRKAVGAVVGVAGIHPPGKTSPAPQV